MKYNCVYFFSYEKYALICLGNAIVALLKALVASPKPGSDLYPLYPSIPPPTHPTDPPPPLTLLPLCAPMTQWDMGGGLPPWLGTVCSEKRRCSALSPILLGLEGRGCVSMCPPLGPPALECKRMEVRNGEGKCFLPLFAPLLLLKLSAKHGCGPGLSNPPSPSTSPYWGSAGSFSYLHTLFSSLLFTSLFHFMTQTQTQALRSHYLRPHPAT